MAYTLIFSDKAAKVLDRIPVNIAKLIRKKLDFLVVDPMRPNNNVTALKGQAGYRLRVGDWRVIYELIHDQLVVYIVNIGPRGGVYD